MSINRLPGEVPLFDTIPFEREKFQADAEQQGRELTAELQAHGQSVDHATRLIHNSPLFASAGLAVDRPLFFDL